jgi:hypothetical protein
LYVHTSTKIIDNRTKIMKTRNMPRKKDPTKRHADKIRPHLYFSEVENWKVEKYRINLEMEKSEFLRACVFYVIDNKLDPRKK